MTETELLDKIDAAERGLRVAYAAWIRSIELYRDVRHRDLKRQRARGDRQYIADVIKEIRLINAKLRQLRAVLASVDDLRAHRDPTREPFGDGDFTL